MHYTITTFCHNLQEAYNFLRVSLFVNIYIAFQHWVYIYLALYGSAVKFQMFLLCKYQLASNQVQTLQHV